MSRRLSRSIRRSEAPPPSPPPTTPTPSGGKLGKRIGAVNPQAMAPSTPKPQVLPLPRVQTQDIPIPQNIVQALQGMPNKTPMKMGPGGSTVDMAPTLNQGTPSGGKTPMPQSPPPPQSVQQFALPPPQSPFAAQPSSFSAPSWMTAAPQAGIGQLLNQIR